MTTTYFPQFLASPVSAPASTRQGIGLPSGHRYTADVARLNCTWYMDWNCANDPDPRYVPMFWNGANGYLPKDYSGYVLVFNEPELATGSDLDANCAARRTMAIQRNYPQAKLIVGGCSYWGEAWLKKFVHELGDFRPAGWHCHFYVEWQLTAGDGIDWLARARAMCPGGEFWLSEFADCTGDLAQAEMLLNLVRNAGWITRYSWFANRLTGLEDYYPQHWENPALIGRDDKLTQLGEMYVQSNPMPPSPTGIYEKIVIE